MSDPAKSPAPGSMAEQFESLLGVTESIISHRNLAELFHDLAAQLRPLVSFDYINVLLHDGRRGVMRLHVMERRDPDGLPAGYEVPVEGTGAGWVWQTQQPLIVHDVDAEQRFPFTTDLFRRYGIHSFYSFPLTSAGRRLGTMGFGCQERHGCGAESLAFLEQVVKQVAVAVDNALNFESATRERARAELLLDVNNAVVSHLSLQDLLLNISTHISRNVHHDLASVVLCDEATGQLRVHALDAPAPGGVLSEGAVLPMEGTPPGLAIKTRATVRRERIDLEEFHSPVMRLAYDAGLRSGCSVPLVSHDRVLGTINVGSLREAAFSEADAELLEQIAGQVAIAVENALNFERAARERERSQLLLEINNAVVSTLDLRDLLKVISLCLRRVIPHDAALLTLHEPESAQLRLQALDLQMFGNVPFEEGVLISLEDTPEGQAITSRRPVLVCPVIDLTRFSSPWVRHAVDNGVRSGVAVPLISHDRTLGALSVVSSREDAFTGADAELLGQCASQIAIAVENALNFEHARKAEQQAARERDRIRLLLEVNNAVVSHLDLKELVKTVSASLRDIMPHDSAGIALYEPEHNHLREYTNVNYKDLAAFRVGDTIPLEGTPAGQVFLTSQPLLIRRPDPAAYPSDHYSQHPVEGSPKSGCLAPLVSHGRKLGIAGVSSTQEETFTEEDLELFSRIAGQVAIAVENALNFEQATREKERAQTLLDVNNAISASLDLRDLMHATSACLRRYFKHDFAGMALYDAESGQLRVHALDLSQPADGYVEEGFMIPLEGSPAGLAFTSRRAVLVGDLGAWEFPSPTVERALAAGIRSSCNAPLVSHDRALGSVVVASRRREAFDESDAELLSHIANQLAIAVENALQYGEIEGLKNKLASEKLYLEEEIKTEYNFAEIVGQSRALRRVLEQVETVAPTDSVVLICGETGTGKELIARAIHSLSARRERTMVKVNCAAIPTGLLESEFFGHERGAFTGAVAQRIGRFELAHKGTLFLDEVGEIPLELQPKLLRVLQEQEFERLGGSRTIKVDVRLIAATNCDLPQMVAERKFRPDLFYRINVFPVVLPPLRERVEDIPLLVGYFAQKHALRMNKRVESVPSETIEALCRYPWPGNVRELENFVERACILTRGPELRAPLAELKTPAAAGDGAHATAAASAAPSKLLSLAEAERAHIEEVLRQTRGVVGGRGGAAEILGLPISTLRGRMKKLGLM